MKHETQQLIAVFPGMTHTNSSHNPHTPHKNERTRAHKHAYTHTYAHTHTRIYTHAHAHPSTHAPNAHTPPKGTHAHTHARTHTLTHTHTSTHTRARARARTRAHTILIFYSILSEVYSIPPLLTIAAPSSRVNETRTVCEEDGRVGRVPQEASSHGDQRPARPGPV